VQFQFQIRTITTHFNAIRARPIVAIRRRVTADLGGARASRSIDRSSPSVESARVAVDRSVLAERRKRAPTREIHSRGDSIIRFDRSNSISSIDRRRRCETVVSGVGRDVGDHGYVHRERERTADDAGGAVADAVDVGGVDHGGAPGRERGEVSVSGGVFGGLHGEIALVV